MKTFYGIDVSKGYADISKIDAGAIRKKFDLRLPDNLEGIDQLKLIVLEDIGAGRHVYLAVESTGGYEDNWYNHFQGFDPKATMIRINPIRIHHESRKNMERNVTDKKSSQNIAIHLSENWEKLVQSQLRTAMDKNMMSLIKSHSLFIKQRTQNYNSLEKLVYGSMPGLLKFWGSPCPQYLLNLLIQYPTKSKLIKAKPNTVSKIKGISLTKATEIQQTVKVDSGINEDELVGFNISLKTQAILFLNRQISEIEIKLKSSDCFKVSTNIIESIRGCGMNSASILSIEIGDVNRFSSADQMCSYFGTHPVTKISGDGQTRPRMSKRGSTRFRSAIYMVAKNTVIYNDYFKVIYNKERQKGKSYHSALGVIMNKLTRIIYGMLKNLKSFDENIPKQKAQVQQINKENEAQLTQKVEILNSTLGKIKSSPTSKRILYRIKKEIEKSQNSLNELKTRSKSISLEKQI